jgi:phospholipid/cholesterol/gamma-HCH transport system substrate-binding protein
VTRRALTGVVLAVALLTTLLVVVLWPGDGEVRASAQFVRAVGLYEGSDVRILGVKVGEVRAVVPDGDRVRVELVYQARYKVPADAKAVVVAPSVVSDRYVQLTPVYSGGPELADGARIPLSRTAVPVELDRIFSSLDDLNVALGPEGANRDGALSRLLEVGAANLDGQGENINQTVRDFSVAVTTLAQNKDDLFGTVRNLQTFTTALAGSDREVRSFNRNLASVADQLAAERQDLALALKHLAVALAEVAAFVKENEANLTTDVAGLADITATLAKQRDAIAEVLEAAPVALGNLNYAYNASSGTLDTRNNAEMFQDPKLYLCSLLRAVGQPQSTCDQVNAALKDVPIPAPGGGHPEPAPPDLTLGGILGAPR